MITVQYNKKIFNDNEISQIQNMYIDMNLSTRKIGDHFNVSKIPIITILKNLNLLRTGNSDGIKIELTDDQKEEIRNLYLFEYMNINEIASKLNLSPAYISKYLSATGYRRNKSNGASIGLVKRYSGVDYDTYSLNLPEQEKYRREVNKLTNQQPIHLLINYEKRGVSGKIGAYHLDHKYSILEGFKNNIKPEIIASLNNLVFIPWEENVIKRTKCSISKEELINL
jgi:predicted DNA-binding protein YlxM (UPF0122 family)